MNSEIMKARSSSSQFQTCKEMMTVKFVTLDLKSMLSEGDIIAVSWGKKWYRGEIKVDTVRLPRKEWVG